MIDLRSDTVTRPTPAMRKAMAEAEVGDDVFDGDPTVVRLEQHAAERFGKEAALFAPSSTQSNLIALLTHCGRGDEYIVGQEAHNYLFEGGGGAALGGLQPQPIPQEDDGTLDLGKVASLIKPDDFHFARTRLLSLENTTWGKVLPASYLPKAKALADTHGLSLHLDGARIFNASVASSTEVKTLTAEADSISVCLSKGLGAPVGSLLIGSADFIKEGKRWRKMLGGGMRQSGIIAAAGLYALENHVERLADDHGNAHRLADRLKQILDWEIEPVQTNMIFVSVPPEKMQDLVSHCKQNGILVGGYSPEKIRLVTHLDISAEDIETTLKVFQAFSS